MTYFLLLSFLVRSRRSEMTENETRQTRPSSKRSAKWFGPMAILLTPVLIDDKAWGGATGPNLFNLSATSFNLEKLVRLLTIQLKN